MVKGKRQNMVDVTLEGEGKLGLVFVKESQPPEIKDIKEGGLAAKARPQSRCGPRSCHRRMADRGCLSLPGHPEAYRGHDTAEGRRDLSGRPRLRCARCAAHTLPALDSLASRNLCDISLDSDCGLPALLRRAARRHRCLPPPLLCHDFAVVLFTDAAIGLIKEAGLPVNLSFKRAPMATKGLFGTVATVGSTSSAAVTTMPSFNFGVKQAGTGTAAPSTGAFKFGVSSASSTASAAGGGFSFGVTKTKSAEPADTATDTDSVAATAEEVEADDAKE